MANYDILGDIAIVKFPRETGKSEKKKFALELLKRQNIRVVLEKIEKVSGKLRTIKTQHIAGEKRKETIHRENGCMFKVNTDSCYFSPRLSEERKEVAGKIKKKDRVLVLFAGVAPFSIIIAKTKGCEVVSVELGRECYKYALENIKLNKVMDKVKVIQGDVRKLEKFVSGKFEVVVMPRPQLKDTFLEYVWKFCKRGTRILYYDFGKDKEWIVDRVLKEAEKAGRKIKITNVKIAGDIAPYAYRWRVDFVVK